MWPRRRAGRPRALVSVSPDQKRPCLGITIGLTPYRGPESAPTLLAATTIPGQAASLRSGRPPRELPSLCHPRPRRLPSPALQ